MKKILKKVSGRRKKLEVSVQADGMKVYGPQTGTRIYIAPSGGCGYHWRSRHQKAHRRAVTKGFPKVLKENGEPDWLVSTLMRLPPFTGELREEHRIIISHLKLISRVDSPTANKMIDELASALKAARRLNGIGSEESGSEKFLEQVLVLCREYRRPPTKGELAERFFNFDSSRVSKSPKKTGLTWLLDNPNPGRRGNIN